MIKGFSLLQETLSCCYVITMMNINDCNSVRLMMIIINKLKLDTNTTPAAFSCFVNFLLYYYKNFATLYLTNVLVLVFYIGLKMNKVR